MRLNKSYIRIISLTLILSMLIGLTPINVFSVDISDNENEKVTVSEDQKEISILHNGAEKESITLNKSSEETITAFTPGVKVTSRSWQILIPDSNTWVAIQGQNGVDLKLSYSIIGSLLNDKDRAYIRITASDGKKDYVSDCLEVIYSHTPVSETAVTASPVTVAAENEAPITLMKAARSGAAAASDSESTKTYTVVINYLFDNGGIAFEPYGASIAEGSDFIKDIVSPTVVGYDPFIRVGETYVDAKTVNPNITAISKNETINVIYLPAIVKYEVHHHLQDLYSDDYSVHYDYITECYGLTGSLVADGLAMTELELPGFTSLAYEKLTVAADGSTVVEIRYNRNYYLVDFKMDGGYGCEPVYVRYGSPVGATAPTRHGYIFNGWQLTKYGDNAPTTEQASMYDINSTIINVPSANLVYTAMWITQLVTYTMVFWKENIEDNGFTYWGSLEGLTAMSGSRVSGANRINEITSITDEDCFTYSADLTDKDVLVEGDGSTTVNVYYTRNRYSITFKAPGLCVIPVGHTHNDNCYDLLCTKGHTHTDSCSPTLSCLITEHTAHTDECLVCGLEIHTHSSDCCLYTPHTHTTRCYSNVGNRSTPTNAPTPTGDGYIYRRNASNYYIYIAGTWYRYNGRNVSTGDIVASTCGNTNHTHGTGCACSITEHTHSDVCYKDTIHVHTDRDCYKYSCNQTGHVHTSGCYILDCGITEKHSHNSTCTRASSTNVVKIEYRKYQENLESIWPIADDNGKVYNTGQRWDPGSTSDTYSAVLVYIANMPGESFTLTLSESSNDTYTMNYYLEVLDGQAYDVEYDGKYFVRYTQVKANYNYITEAEDFFNINGFYKYGSNPEFKSGQIDINGGGTVNFYYGRIVDHYLEFNNNGTVISNKTQHGLPYQQSLKDFYFVPDYPSSLEPGAFVFAGWYTSPGLFDGTEVNWDTLVMSSGDIMLYAKWTPITHSVSVYLDNTFDQQIGSTQYINHGSFAIAPNETISNGNYIFQGWFYEDNDNGEIVEKAFVFTGIPVMDDMKIYAKWSSHVTVDYVINYILDINGQTIADSTVGSAIAGHNKTFYAKTGSDLYTGFQEGYYPLTSSHTVTMSAEYDLEFTFRYVYVESMPYLVRYLDSNGQKVAEDKRVMDNNYSVVTETFVKLSEMMPDAYQKRLVLSADKTDEDEDGIYDDNVITFYYSVNTINAYYRVVHYIENIHRDDYREYLSEDTIGDIGSTYSIPAISITGFSFKGAKTKINGASTPTNGSSVNFELTNEGALIELYYDRATVNYTVKYLDYQTKNVLYESKNGTGIFGEQIMEHAVGLTSIGYTLVGDAQKQINLSANEAANVIEFYYQESMYSIKYQIVGAPEGGILSQSSENVLAVSGQAVGSIPYVLNGYHFVGWFTDEACTTPVPAEWVVNDYLTPQKENVWLQSSVYYAKIDPDFTTLTVSTVGVEAMDADQVFIFFVSGLSKECQHIDLTLTVSGNSSVTITNLPIGTYSVTEVIDWSFRYTPDATAKTITLSVTSTNTVTFLHIKSNNMWLDGNADQLNDFN